MSHLATVKLGCTSFTKPPEPSQVSQMSTTVELDWLAPMTSAVAHFSDGDSAFEVKYQTEVKKTLDGSLVLDCVFNYKVTSGSVSNAVIDFALHFDEWSVDNYVAMPGAIYNGNRITNVTTDQQFWASAPTPAEVPLAQIRPIPRLVRSDEKVSEQYTQVALYTLVLLTTLSLNMVLCVR